MKYVSKAYLEDVDGFVIVFDLYYCEEDKKFVMIKIFSQKENLTKRAA